MARAIYDRGRLEIILNNSLYSTVIIKKYQGSKNPDILNCTVFRILSIIICTVIELL
jgi:hypothetical protein